MFSNNRKTIGFFVGRTIDYFQKIMCKGVINQAEELGYNLAIFSSFGEFGGNKGFAGGEKEIIHLPKYENLDGIVMAPDTFDIDGMQEELVCLVHERCHCPVVSIRREIEGFYNIMTNDDVVMESVIRHFIVDHGFKKICFMSGPKGVVDGDRRLNCFLRLMKEYGLPVGKNQIYHGNFWKGTGKWACDNFFKDEENQPQAIICANDYMAIDVCNELFNRGLRIPQDVSVCGYDGIKETDLYIPTITTVEVPFLEMGRKSVETVHNALLGKQREKKIYLQAVDRYKESCGCKRFDKVKQSKDQKEFFERTERIRENGMQSTFMSIDLEEITGFEQLSDVVAKYVFNIKNFEDFYMFLCDEEELDGKPYSKNNTFTTNMKMKMGISRSGRQWKESAATFPKEELLPKELASEEPMVYYFMPLHFNEHCFGYTAIRFQDGTCYDEFYEPFMVNIGNALEAIYVRDELKRLLWEMEEMNVKDYLTGLLNRRGLMKYSQIYMERAKEEGLRIFVMGLDLDGLKMINDRYGHEEGDNALRVMSKALRKAAIHREICARVGGDEFNVVGLHYTDCMAKEYLERFLSHIDHYNETSGKPYKVVASYGVYVSKENENRSFYEYLRISDDRMYRQKNEKKKKKRTPRHS